MRVIAVYSDVDKSSLHVSMADEAYHIGAAPAGESYLDHEKILAVAKSSGAECLHPGYGFLSENAAFAEACVKQGVVFVGPPSKAIDAMGLKDAAKRLMQDAGVAVVPGYLGDDQDTDYLAKQAEVVGYPVLIKAVAGGGGKGMRRVDGAGQFSDALKSCQREAKAAFGDDRVLIERFIASPRHIEVQVFCDTHGNAVHLFERDCSMQRRHQKVIEEAPAPGVSPEMREAMCAAAVRAARAVGYVGAGTVEFIADASDGLRADAFYFMEMNTRLQVEHPVTEAITGIDLVEWQFLVASGLQLPKKQSDISMAGHAIEARVYAEDPANGFLPQVGRIYALKWPSDAESVRIDSGVQAGAAISPYYDPMIAKVICHGDDRQDAINRLSMALNDLCVLGLRTNISFNRRLVQSEAFGAGRHDTSTIDTQLETFIGPDGSVSALAVVVEAWLHVLSEGNAGIPGGSWTALSGWALAGIPRQDRLWLEVNGESRDIRVDWVENGRVLCVCGENEVSCCISQRSVQGDEIRIEVDGALHFGRFVHDRRRSTLYVHTGDEHYVVRQADVLNRASEAGGGGAEIRAPMSGRIIEISVSEGQAVVKGQQLAILEAMKMEHPLSAGYDATVKSVNAAANAQVGEGFVVIELTASDSE
jgi:3-methylcrotonyl-CoA carboxylase alpha subunit